MVITPKILWQRFLMWPVLVVLLLVIYELGQPLESGKPNWGIFLTKVSASLVGYGVGSIVPYILSDEFLYTRFATLFKKGDQRILVLNSVKEKNFESAKTNVQTVFVVGLVCWVANQFLPGRPMFSQYPLLARWFWITGPIYCLGAGFLYVYMRKGPQTDLDLAGETSQIGEQIGEGMLSTETESHLANANKPDSTQGAI